MIQYYSSRIRPPYYKVSQQCKASYEVMNNTINDCYRVENEIICHKTLLKLILNPILRFIQFWTDKPLVLASVSDYCPVNGYYFIRYEFIKVKQIKS